MFYYLENIQFLRLNIIYLVISISGFINLNYFVSFLDFRVTLERDERYWRDRPGYDKTSLW